MVPYTLMTLSIAHLLLEIIAPKELRYVVYDFSDRLFFKFIYRPINKCLQLLKNFIIFNLRKIRDLLKLSEQRKAIRKQKRIQRKIVKTEKKQTALIIKNQKREIKAQEKRIKQQERKEIKEFRREEKLQNKLIKKEEKLNNKIENKRLKNETVYKLKLIIAYKIKKIINKNNAQ